MRDDGDETAETYGTGQRHGVRGLLVRCAGTALGVPLAGLAFVAWLAPTLPQRVAVHWGVTGDANGFGSRYESAYLALGFGLAAFVALFAVVRLQDSGGRRIVAAVAVFVPCLVTLTNVVSLATQSSRFGAAASASGKVGPLGWWVLPAALVLGAAATWAAVGPSPTPRPRRQPGGVSPSLPHWTGTARSPVMLWVLLAVEGAVVVAVVSVTAADGGSGAMLGIGAILVGVGLLLAAMSIIRVTVDGDGLDVRTGLPLLRRVDRLASFTPLDQIRQVEVVSVRPFAEFGGWGYRIGRGGRVGIVIRGGEALEVLRGSGSRLVITVDGAADAARTLELLMRPGTPGRR